MNALVNDFKGRLGAIKAWRHHLHKHPELSLEEIETAKYIADFVRSWGFEVVEGVGKHGVVASLTAGNGTSPLGYAQTPTPFQSKRTTIFLTRVRSPVYRICAVTMGTRRCCSRLANTWRALATSTVPSG